jgi:hypothetical protein
MVAARGERPVAEDRDTSFESVSMVRSFPVGDDTAPESSLIASIACHAPTTPAAAPTMPASAHPGESFREGIRGITHRRQGPSPGTIVSIWPPNRRTPAWMSGRRVTTAASLQRYFVEKLSLPSTIASYARKSAAAFAAVSASGYASTARSGRNDRSAAAAESAFHCPTASDRWITWRLRLVMSTRSSSITPIRPIPAAAR